MILYFADRSFTVQGVATTSLDSQFVIVSDTKTESVEKHISSFDVEVSFNEDNRKELEELTNAGNYILRYVSSSDPDGDEGEDAITKTYTQNNVTDCFTIIESEIDIQGKTISIYAEDLGLDLLNDIADPYDPGSYMPAADYILNFVSKAGFKIGLNEIPYDTRALAWTDTSTVTDRLNSIAATFECELSYSFTIKGMTLTDKFVNIHKKRGIDTYEMLSIGRNLNNIKVKRVASNLATALIPTGSDSLNLVGYDYDDGDFYVQGGVLYSRKALENWHRFRTESGHIFRTFSTEVSQQEDLFQAALKELKKVREPEVNYEVDIAELPAGLGIGDRVYVVDDAGELYVQGRILELKTSETNKRQEATIGDYKIQTSGISQVVADLASSFAEVAARRVLYTWIIYAEDSSGTNPSMTRGSRNFTGILANRRKELTSDEQLTSEVLADVQWTFMLDSEAASTAIITLVPSDGTIYKGKKIATTLTATVTVGDKVIQNKTQLARYFGANAELVWYEDGVELQNEGNFTLTYQADDGVETVTISCELEVS